MFWLKLIKRLLKALNADVSPAEIAGGIVLGSIIGLTPAFAIHNVLIFVLIIILKVNISAAVFASIMFGIIGLAVDPLAHLIGEKLLLAAGLNALWTTLYNMPIAPLTRFNNTVVLGSLVISLVLIIPIYIFSKKFVVAYRKKWQQRIQKLKIVKLLKASRVYKFYMRFKR